MDYQVSARKYRPGTFGDVIGQPHVVQTLMNAVSTKCIAHAYLFSGTRGVGKTTVARILAKALNCERGPTGRPCNACVNCREIAQGNSVDVIEIDGASNTSVDDVREIRENVKFMPFRGQYRVYIIDEVHMLSNSAFNALLKTLEEPPSHVVFIFATTEIHRIPATILSRCQHYNFRRIAQAEIIDRLRHVADQDRLTIEERSFTALARASEGSMRDALSLLDQAVAFRGKSISHADLELLLGAVPQELVQGLVRGILAQDSLGALNVLANVLDQGHDLRAFCAEVVEQFRNLLVAAVVPASAELHSLIEASDEDVKQFAADGKVLTPEQLEEILVVFSEAEHSLRFSQHPRFVMEIAAIRTTRLLRRRDGDIARPVQTVSVTPPTQPPPIRSENYKSKPDSPQKATLMNASIPRSEIPPTASKHGSMPDLSIQAESGGGISPLSMQPVDESVASKATVFPVAQNVALAGGQPMLDWEAVREKVAVSFPNIAPFLEAGRLVGFEKAIVTIGFTKQATVARTRLEKAENLITLAKLCEEQSGHPVRIRIVELSERIKPGPTMAQERAAKEQDQRFELFERARANPTVKQALDMFGAELVEVRPVIQKEASQ